MSIDDGGSPFVAQKDASPTSAPSGTWTVTVRNTGTAASSGTTQVVFNAAPNGGYTGYLQSVGGSGWNCDSTGFVATCTNTAPVPAGGSLPPLTFPFASRPGYGTAWAQATLTNPSDGTVNNNTLNVLTPVIEPASTIDVVATVSDEGSSFTAGSLAAYTVRVQNVGTMAASGDITVHYPTPFVGMAAVGTGWTCTDSDCTYSGGLAAGSTLPPLTITGTVPAQDAPATVRAEVRVDNASDAFTNDNYTYLETSITPLPIDVVASVSDGGAPFTAGKQAVYTVRVRNVGTSAATNDVTVHYPVPFTGMVATGTGWTCSASSGLYPTCTYSGGLAAGSTLPLLTITGTVPAQDAPATVRAEVRVDNASDAFTNDNYTYLETGITPLPIDVVASVSDGGAPFSTGDEAAYTVRVRNVGTSDASGNVVVYYPVPFAGMVATGTGWTCTDYSTGSDPTCTHQGGLAAGSTLPPLTLTGPVPAQDAPATVRAEVRVQNASDAFTNDNYTYLETAITTFSPGGGYVALGDSYSSGEGVPDASGQFIPPSNSPSPNDRCHRSYYAYSQDVIGTAGFPPATMTAFWACSGAIIADYTHPNAKNNEPSQQSHLLRPDGSPDSSIALVSLTMGGNDVEFPSVMFSCTRILKCEKLEDPIVTLLINHTEPRLAQLYGEILRDAPKARIFVLGYPRIVASIPSLKCQLAGIEPSEATWFNKKAAQLDNAISKAVSQVANARLHFVSTLNAFAGGEACSRSGSTGGTYMNGVDLTHIEYSFHPNQAGQEILASLLAHAVRGS